jgi:hypothetical protein
VLRSRSQADTSDSCAILTRKLSMASGDDPIERHPIEEIFKQSKAATDDPAFARLLELTDAWFHHWRATRHESLPIEKERHLWELTVDLLKALAEHRPIMLAAGVGVQALLLAAEGIGGALAGKPPAPWKGKSRALSQGQLEAISQATLYVKLVNDGELPVGRAVTTVCAVYQISYDRWRKKFRDVPPAAINLEDHRATAKHLGPEGIIHYWLERLAQAARVYPGGKRREEGRFDKRLVELAIRACQVGKKPKRHSG